MEEIIPTGLRLDERTASEPVSDNFAFQWNALFDTENKLVKLLPQESEKVIEKIELIYLMK